MQHMDQFIRGYDYIYHDTKYLYQGICHGRENEKKVFHKLLDVYEYDKNESYKNPNMITLFHGQWKMTFWSEIIYTKIRERLENKSYKNFLFLRFWKNKGDIASHATEYEKIVEHLQNIAQYGTQDHEKDRPKQIFLNPALFSNLGNRGSHTPNYVLKDYNQHNTTFDSYTIFENNGLEKYHEKYKKQLMCLEERFRSSIPGGILLRITAPSNVAKNVMGIYPAKSGGFKTTKNIDEKDTDDAIQFCHALRTNQTIKDADITELVAPIDENILHTWHDAGVNIEAFHSADQKKYAEIMKELDTILDAVFKDYEQDLENTQGKLAKEFRRTVLDKDTPKSSYEIWKQLHTQYYV